MPAKQDAAAAKADLARREEELVQLKKKHNIGDDWGMLHYICSAVAFGQLILEVSTLIPTFFWVRLKGSTEFLVSVHPIFEHHNVLA
jgi:hypothetical protein